jgi:2-methylisocitrate lyase-like PEP mutase family enzyme
MNPRAKAERFQALHKGPAAFVIPNPWDGGSARILAGLGYQALATSSGACAGVLGRRDGRVTRDEALAHAQAIVAAVDLPVSADLEKCFADAPREVAETIRLAAGIGLAGGSIEDASGSKEKPIYDFAHAVERVAAAAEAAKKAGFVLTARSENYLRGKPDLDDTIKRLQAFAAAGADVLYAPGLRDLETIRRLTAAVQKPVNIVMSAADPELTAKQLESAGVKRISVGGALSRLAYATVRDAAIAMRDTGSFRWVRDTLPARELNAILGPSRS